MWWWWWWWWGPGGVQGHTSIGKCEVGLLLKGFLCDSNVFGPSSSFCGQKSIEQYLTAKDRFHCATNEQDAFSLLQTEKNQNTSIQFLHVQNLAPSPSALSPK